MSGKEKLALLLAVCLCYLALLYFHKFSDTVTIDASFPSPIPVQPTRKIDNIVIVFSHSPPLDETTATLTTEAVVKKAASFFKDNPSSFFVFASSVHARRRSEAELMGELAVSMGIPKDNIHVDRDTQKMLKKATAIAHWLLAEAFEYQHIYLIADFGHIRWLETTLRSVVIEEYPAGKASRFLFSAAIPLACASPDRGALIEQLKQYLARPENSNKERVRSRLHMLQNNIAQQPPS